MEQWKPRSILVLLGLMVLTLNLSAQNNFGLKYFGLSMHPKGEKDNAFLMPRKWDKEAYLVLNIGGVISYEHFIHQDILSIKIAQALYADCAARAGGLSHIGVRGSILKKGKHRLNGGIGPTIVYRRNWLEMDGYSNPNRFKGGQGPVATFIFMVWRRTGVQVCLQQRMGFFGQLRTRLPRPDELIVWHALQMAANV